MRARERDPAARYPSALELAREGAMERAGRFLLKHQFVAWLVLGYLTLRALVFFFYRR